MKRVITLLLAFVLMISMCACGSKELSAEERERIYQEVAAEKAEAENADSEVVEEESKFVSENENFKLDAICVDDSYHFKNSDVLRRVYLFFTVSATDANLQADSLYMYLTVNGTNEYKSHRILDGRHLFPRYSHSDTIQYVYLGESLKVFMVFEIPEADLSSGRTITLRDNNIPGIDEIVLSTDMIQHFSSQEEMAKAIDAEGYEEYLYMCEEADEETAHMINEKLVGKKYFTQSRGITYSVSFKSSNKCKAAIGPISFDGTYSIRNGFIFVFPDESPEKPYMISYKFADDMVNMDVAEMIGM